MIWNIEMTMSEYSQMRDARFLANSSIRFRSIEESKDAIQSRQHTHSRNHDSRDSDEPQLAEQLLRLVIVHGITSKCSWLEWKSDETQSGTEWHRVDSGMTSPRPDHLPNFASAVSLIPFRSSFPVPRIGIWST